tara:strand:- start:906 stop:1835 length:930 start_codon:yes stop_codon:yes gene_type:complete
MASSSIALPPVLTRAYERYGRLIPRLAEIVLVILIGSALARLAWQFVPAPEAEALPASGLQTSGATPASADAGNRQAIARIVAANLFGKFEAPKTEAPQDIEDAPDTRLNLTLFGILAATAERGSRALISSPQIDGKPYAIGDDVDKGVRLQAIFPDRVILARAGQLETLRMQKLEGAATARSASPGQQRSVANNRNDAVSVSADTAAMLSDIREKLLADPGQAANYVRVQPASRGGQLRGYRLYPGRERAAFTAAGLRPGDLVTQVNGIQLNDANTALQMLGQLSQATSLTIVVERGGREQTMNVTFN